MGEPSVVTKMLSDLVAIPSVNPLVIGGKATDGEGELGHFVHHTLRAAGLDVTIQPVHPGRANIIAHLDPSRSRGDDNVVLLSAHMDTYPPSQEGTAEFEPTISSGRLYGRGSADAKGSLAAMIVALLAASKAHSRREAHLVASIDEEFGMTGVRQLLSYGIRASIAITGEPTLLQPITAQKGIVRFSICVQGDISHAAHPSSRNAILDLESLLRSIRTFNFSLSERKDRDLGSATLCATGVECDGDMNKSPGKCRLSFDARFLPGDSAELFLKRLDDYLRLHMEPGIHFELESPLFISPANRCSLELPLVGELFRSIEVVRGNCIPGCFAYGSEAGYLSQISAASLVLGPGDPQFSHGPGESIEIRELEDAVEIFERIIVT